VYAGLGLKASLSSMKKVFQLKYFFISCVKDMKKIKVQNLKLFSINVITQPFLSPPDRQLSLFLFFHLSLSVDYEHLLDKIVKQFVASGGKVYSLLLFKNINEK
jgi:hypothetical protein